VVDVLNLSRPICNPKSAAPMGLRMAGTAAATQQKQNRQQKQ